MKKWLSVIGMGEDGVEGLSARAKSLLLDAEVVVGSKRLLGFLPALRAEIVEWPQPFSAVVQKITPFRGRDTVILATGDPLNYGVARKLMEFVDFSEMTIIPHLSSFSLAAARLGWSLPDCDTLSLHGRDAAGLEPFIQPAAHLIVLTADATTIHEVARRLVARGFENSEIAVLENMGGDRERLSRHTASNLGSDQFSDLNTIGVTCVAGPKAEIRPRLAGLPDDAFVHDGQLTKREVRAATLAALAPAPDQLLWDIGAGCGSVAVEWMRSTRGCNAIAFEHHEERLRMIAQNADRLGTPRLRVVSGSAPKSLENMASPHAVFIGGGVGIPGVFETAWQALKPQGRMVANVVTLEGEMHLYDLHEKFGGELVRVEISTLAAVGPYRAMKPRMPVTQWRCIKP